MLPMLSIVGLYFLDGKKSLRRTSYDSLGVVEGQEISTVQEKVILSKLLDKCRHFFTSLFVFVLVTQALVTFAGSVGPDM